MMRTKYVNVLFVVLEIIVFFSTSECAKILGIFPCPGYSQYIIGSSLLIPLAEKGHDVTVISIHETKNIKNYKNLLMENQEEKYKSDDILKLRHATAKETQDVLYSYGLDITQKTLSDKNVQKLINSNETFDLIIMEMICTDALATLAEHFKAKLIFVTTMGLNEFAGYTVGNPMLPSIMPAMNSQYTSEMSFFERTRNAFIVLYDAYKRYIENAPKQQELVDKYMPKKYNVETAIYSADLMFANGHPSMTEAFPVTHAVKEIGGFHINSKQKPLPEDMRKFLESATKGAILFSMGSNVKSSDMPEEVLHRILQDFGKMKQKILWKFEIPNLKNKPENVMISKWLPQKEIIAHPNTVAFIGHGGLLSSTEAMYYGVPMIGIPIFCDQFMNLRRIEKWGMGILLPYEELATGGLKRALNKILKNPSFKQNAEERSRLLKDRPISPLEEAIFWVEHTLRHNGTRHLRSPILDLSWYQVYLLDVFALFFGILIIVIFLIVLSLKMVSRVTKTKSQTETVKKNK